VTPLITTQLSSRQKFTKTRLNAQKERKMGVFRPFVRLNGLLKIFVCLGCRGSPVGVPCSMP